MQPLSPLAGRTLRYVAVVMLFLTLLLAIGPQAKAQLISQTRAVGGVSINPEGLLENATVDNMGKLGQLAAKAVGQVPGDLNEAAPLRKVSLRRLEEAIQTSLNAGNKELPPEIRYLAGLQQIQYVFVYPEEHDIVLVGPGQGWKADRRGNIVGVDNGQPVLLLDDLLVAFRSARQAAQGGISCSIDPTPEGLDRLRIHASKLRTIGNPSTTAAGIERSLGMQQISVQGVPASSHFARVLVAADFRMKRLAMNFEPSPVRGLPSYLQMIKASGRGMNNMLPRWWLEPNYQEVLKSPDGLAWELRGGSVKAMTEEDFLTAAGDREHTGKANPMAKQWADNMTAKYDELAVAEPIFGELRNCMELAVVTALITKERLAERAGGAFALLSDSPDVKTAEFPAPKQVASKASVMKKGRNWVISASGGVLINSYVIADKTRQSDEPAKAKSAAGVPDKTNWRWN
ncbi:MAG: DUF1598 domain-containing protein [Candidatus Nealsonbacteria bacterium]|nr:DUF1598 domain-containing protein [Candidatus Nealsonbacteria bacterium]